jgi:demethylsterigmatocystin 6-O-methyltransferase
MDTIIDQVRQLGLGASEEGRKSIIDQLRTLSNELETQDDTLQRFMYRHLETAAVRIGCDLKIFNYLDDSKTPLTLDQLQEKTGAARILLARILRYLSSTGAITEPDINTWGANNITRTLAIPGNQAGIYHNFDLCGPLYQELPTFLAKTNYLDVTDNLHTVWQDAFKTDKDPFQLMMENPEKAENFNRYMAHRRKDMPTWLNVFPVEQYTKNWDPNGVVFVDIGGNVGHVCAELKAKYPELPGKVVLQDLPHAITMALETPGVENMIHDAFTPEPIKGARFYYLRHVLHDFPDHKVVEILQNIIPAMGKDSIILLDEMLFPDKNVHWHATEIDLTMMSTFASIERTRTYWEALLGSVGLKITETYCYTPSIYETVMVVQRK